MKLARFLKEYQNDIAAIAEHFNIDVSKITFSGMFQLFHYARQERCYDDTHPRYQKHPRILPYDGSDYGKHYEDGANDDHLITLIKRIQKNLVEIRC